MKINTIGTTLWNNKLDNQYFQALKKPDKWDWLLFDIHYIPDMKTPWKNML